jgi:hypothetical protein
MNPLNRLGRQDSSASPFTRRKSPRATAFETSEQVSGKVREACQKTDAGLVMRMLASVALSLAPPSKPLEPWDFASDQDAFFEGVPDLPARAFLKDLCRQMNDKSAFELVACRFREWWPNARLVSSMNEQGGVPTILRACCEPAATVAAEAVKSALTGPGLALGDNCLRSKVDLAVLDPGETVNVTHTRTELVTDKDDKTEFTWACCFILSRREMSIGSAAKVKKHFFSCPRAVP